MIIDKTYFKGNLRVANVQEDLTPLGSRTGNQPDLDEYIEKYEVEIMLNALGYKEYKSFIDSFEPDGTLKAGAEQRWVDLVNGKDYTSNGVELKWRGLRYVLGSQKYSLIAEYVFYFFLREQSRTFAGVGMVREKAKAAENESAIPRLADAWNDFVVKYQGDAELDEYPRLITKPGLIGIDYSLQFDSDDVSLYRFLVDNEVDYPDVKFKFYEGQNSLGI